MRYELLENYYNSNEYLAKLQLRANYIKKAEADEVSRARFILEDWAVNPISFIETFLWIKVNKFNNQIKPFFLLDYQKEYILQLLDKENDHHDHEFLITKPREMGLSWVTAAYIIWRWTFTPNWNAFVMSRTETEVDNGSDDPDSSLFGKLRFLIKKLPPWIKPIGYQPKVKKGTITDSLLTLRNPQMGSSVIGSSTNSNAGRSRRYSIVFIDECFAIDAFNEVYRALQTVSNVKIFVSTVNADNLFIARGFKDLCEKKGEYMELTYKDSPFKDDIWYQEQMLKAEFDPDILKELGADFNVNSSSQYYPEISQARLEPVVYDPTKDLYASLDFGRQDLTVIVWWQWTGRNLNIVECYANSKRPLDWYAPFLNPDLKPNEKMYSPYQLGILNKVQTMRKPRAYFGEVAHKQRVMPLNRSIADELIKYQVRLLTNDNAVSHQARRNATSLMLPKCIFNSNSDYVQELHSAISNSRYASNTRSVTTRESMMKPVHDKMIADYRSAFENGMVNIPRILRGRLIEREPGNKGIDPVIGSLVKTLKV